MLAAIAAAALLCAVFAVLLLRGYARGRKPPGLVAGIALALLALMGFVYTALGLLLLGGVP